MDRIAKVKRETNEVKVDVELNIDGTGDYSIDTGIPFFDHMLEQLSKHGYFDLKIKAGSVSSNLPTIKWPPFILGISPLLE